MAYKFDLLQTTMNIGSGVALFGAGTFVCDLMILYFLRNKDIYRNVKTDVVTKTALESTNAANTIAAMAENIVSTR